MLKKFLVAGLFLQAIDLYSVQKFTTQEEQALMQIDTLEQCLQDQLTQIPNDTAQIKNIFYQFATTLTNYLADHATIVKKSDDITNSHEVKLYIGSKDDVNEPLTANLHSTIINLCEQANNIPAWRHTMVIPVLVTEDGNQTMQKLRLTEIIEGLKMVPLPANYYVTAENFLKTAAACTLIGLGGYLAYKTLYGADQQIHTINSQTDNQKNTNEINSKTSAASTDNNNSAPHAQDLNTRNEQNSPATVSTASADTSPANTDSSSNSSAASTDNNNSASHVQELGTHDEQNSVATVSTSSADTPPANTDSLSDSTDEKISSGSENITDTNGQTYVGIIAKYLESTAKFIGNSFGFSL